MVKVDTIATVVLNMSEDEVKNELIILLSLESDEEKLIHINTMFKRIGNKLASRNKAGSE